MLLSLVLAAGVDAGLAPFSWDVPEQVQLVPVGRTLERNGLPIKVFLARSNRKLDELLLHYAGRFVAAGYFIPPRVELKGFTLPRVVAFDDVRGVSFFVYGWPEPDGTTTLVLGAADVAHRKPAMSATGLPVFPGATQVSSFDIELARALSFSANATSAEVIDFYRSVLPTGGWKEREPGSFVKDGHLVRVLARPAKSGPDAGHALSVVVLDEIDQGPGSELPTPP